MFEFLGQAAPTGDSLVGLLPGLGTSAILAIVLWTILQQREKRHAQEIDVLTAQIALLTNRLFLLADKSTEVAGRAQRVVERDSEAENAELRAQMDRLAGLLEKRGRP